MAGSFPYEPLIGSEIRLVSVKIESPKDEIHCKIETVPLDEHLKYYALSYVWGARDRLAITLEDRNFTVTKNLFGFLWQLLEWVKNGDFDEEVGNGGPVGFWIDAICLDQSNPDEKSKQVPRMKDIYSSAVRVYGWLGVPAPLDDQLVRMVFEKANEITADPRARDIKWIQNYSLVSDLGLSYAAFTEAFLSIIQRPWFSRIWIIQEAVLARTEPLFVIGPHFTNALSILSIIYTSALKKNGDPREGVTLQRNLGPIKLQRLRGYYQSLDVISTSLSSQGVSVLAIFAKRLNRIMRDTTLNYKSALAHDMILLC